MTTSKICTGCKVEKALEEYAKLANGKFGRHPKCKECSRAEFKARRAADPQRDRDRCREYKARNKEKVLAYYRDYRSSNKHIRAKSQAARRASYCQSGLSKHFAKQLNQIYALSDKLTKQLGQKFHVDHIYPLRGDGEVGLHVPWNLRIVPATENMAKGNKRPDAPRINFDWLKDAFPA